MPCVYYSQLSTITQLLIVPLNALHWPAHLNLYLSLLWNQHSPALCICLPTYVLVSNSEL